MNCNLKIIAKRVNRLNLKSESHRFAEKREILLLVFHTNASKTAAPFYSQIYEIDNFNLRLSY